MSLSWLQEENLNSRRILPFSCSVGVPVNPESTLLALMLVMGKMQKSQKNLGDEKQTLLEAHSDNFNSCILLTMRLSWLLPFLPPTLYLGSDAILNSIAVVSCSKALDQLGIEQAAGPLPSLGDSSATQRDLLLADSLKAKGPMLKITESWSDYSELMFFHMSFMSIYSYWDKKT